MSLLLLLACEAVVAWDCRCCGVSNKFEPFSAGVVNAVPSCRCSERLIAPMLLLSSSCLCTTHTHGSDHPITPRSPTPNRRWEACSAWNVIVSSTTHLGRQATQWLPSSHPDDALPRAALLRWLGAFPIATMAHLREEEEKLPELLDGCV